MLKSISTFLNAITGNLTFLGTGNRILGDFSNATLNDRVAIKTSTPNANTGVFVLPNGTAVNTNVQCYNNSNPTNSSVAIFGVVGSTDVRIQSAIQGSGTLLPMTLYAGSAERARVKTTGQVRFVPLASAPSGAEAGDVYYDNGTNKLRVYNGTSWVDLH
jgi:hypothetical protein